MFDTIGREITHARDPALSLPNHQWNFLPLMPYLWAVLGKLGLAWADVVKVPVIGCDVINV